MYAYTRIKGASQTEIRSALYNFFVNTVGFTPIWNTDPTLNTDFANQIVTRATNTAITPGKVMLAKDTYAATDPFCYQFGSAFTLTTLPTTWSWTWNKTNTVNSNAYASVFLNSLCFSTTGEDGSLFPAKFAFCKTDYSATAYVLTSFLGVDSVFPLSANVFSNSGIYSNGGWITDFDLNCNIEIYANKNLIYLCSRPDAAACYTNVNKFAQMIYPVKPAVNVEQLITSTVAAGTNVVIPVPQPYLFIVGKYYYLLEKNGRYAERVKVLSVTSAGPVVDYVRRTSGYTAGDFLTVHTGRIMTPSRYHNYRFNTPLGRNFVYDMNTSEYYSDGNYGDDTIHQDRLWYRFPYGDYMLPSNNGLYAISEVHIGAYDYSNDSGYIPGSDFLFISSGDVTYNDQYLVNQRYYSTIGGCTSLILTDLNANWETDQFAGKTLVIASGIGLSQARKIVSNTSTTLTIGNAFDIVPAAGDAYAVADESYRAPMSGQGNRSGIICREVY